MDPPAENSADEATASKSSSCCWRGACSSLPGVYGAAVRDGVDRPVVILLDCEDAIGGQIARGWLGSEVVDEAIAEQRVDDPSCETTTVFARAVSLAESARQIPEVFPYLAPVSSRRCRPTASWRSRSPAAELRL